MHLERSGWMRIVREGPKLTRITVKGGGQAFQWKTRANIKSLLLPWKPEFDDIRRQEG